MTDSESQEHAAIAAIIEGVDDAWSWDASPEIYTAYAIALTSAGYRRQNEEEEQRILEAHAAKARELRARFMEDGPHG